MTTAIRLIVRAKCEPIQGLLDNLISDLALVSKSIEREGPEQSTSLALATLACQVEDANNFFLHLQEWIKNHPDVEAEAVGSAGDVLLSINSHPHRAFVPLELPHILPDSSFTMELRIPRQDSSVPRIVEDGQHENKS